MQDLEEKLKAWNFPVYKASHLYFYICFGCFFSFLLCPLLGIVEARNLFVHLSYYFLFALVLCFFYCAYQVRSSARPLMSGKEHGLALFLCFFLAAFVWLHIGHYFKVLSDEAVQMGVSYSFFSEKTAFFPNMGQWFYDSYWPVEKLIDKRPLLFPFLLHFVHILLGYSIENVFFFNAFLLFLLLYTVFLMLYPLAGFLGSLGGVFLLLAQPILSINAISGGYDLLACFLQFYIVYLVLQLCQKDRPYLKVLIWYALLALMHVRYENFIALPIVFLLLNAFGKFPFSEFKRHPYLYAMSLLFVLPRLWHFMFPHDYENPKGVPVIGWMNFKKHLPLFLEHFFAPLKEMVPYATVLNTSGFFIALFWVVFFMRKRFEFFHKKYLPLALVMCFFAFSQLVITLSHHFGVYHHPTQARLFLTFVSFLSLTPFLLKSFMQVPSKLFLLAGLSFFAMYFPVAQGERYSKQLLLIRRTKWTYDFYEHLQSKNILIITERPGNYTIRLYGAVSKEWALENASRIRNDLHHKRVDQVFIEELVASENEASNLDEHFEMKTAFIRQNAIDQYVRISEVLR